MSDASLPLDEAIARVKADRTTRRACECCEGTGGVVETVPRCCGRLSPSGGCYGDCAIPELIQDACPDCGGTGYHEIKLQESET